MGLFVVALALRSQVSGVPPLYPAIRSDLGIPHAVVGLLATIPLLLMGLFAPPARDIAARLGARRALAGCLLLISVAGIARAALPGPVALIVLTVPIGIGMGVAGPLMAVFVKKHFSDRPAFATGVYATGLQISAATSAAAAAPIAVAWGGWRVSLAIFSGVSFALLAVWIGVMRGVEDDVDKQPERLRLPLRSGIAWLLVGLFGLQSLVYYGVTSWLPALYVERGWSDSRAGLLLSVVNISGIPAGIVVPWFADRIGTRRTYIVGAATILALALLGIELMPGGAWLWVVLVGASGGVLFSFFLTLPLDVADLPGGVGSVAGMMLLGGYLIAAVGPFTLGAVRDLTGSFSASIALLVVCACGTLAGGLMLTPRRLRGGVGRVLPDSG